MLLKFNSCLFIDFGRMNLRFAAIACAFVLFPRTEVTPSEALGLGEEISLLILLWKFYA